MGYVRRMALLAAAGSIVLAFAVSGCGSGASESTVVGSSTASSDSAGSFRIMNITTLTGTTGSETPEAAEALAGGVEALNAAGGVNGQTIELIQCDDQGDPNRARSCARQAVEKEVVATVGDASGLRESYMPILEEAGIAVVGALPSSAVDFTSKVAFPVAGGVPALYQGIGQQLVNLGHASKIGAVLTEFPGVSAFSGLLKEGLEGTGASVTKQTLVPIGTPDLQGAVASSTGDGVDGVALLLLVNENIRYIQEARSAGYEGPIDVADWSSQAMEQLGSAAEGVMVTSYFQPLSAGGPTIERYKREMAKYAPKCPLEKLGAINAWVALQVFAHAIEGVKSVDKESVLKGMSEVEGFELGGFIPTYSTTTEFADPNYPRLFNHDVWFEQVKAGELALAQPKAVDPFGK